jgi:hypothetical protein
LGSFFSTATISTAVIACFAALSGCATDTVEGANWVGPRTAPPDQAYAPSEAMRHNIEGWAMLLCVAGEGQMATHCVPLAETPPGWGFGDAAMRMRNNLRGADTHSFGGHVPKVGESFKIPVVFCPPLKAATCAAEMHAQIAAFSNQIHSVAALAAAGKCAEASAAVDAMGQSAFTDYWRRHAVCRPAPG